MIRSQHMTPDGYGNEGFEAVMGDGTATKLTSSSSFHGISASGWLFPPPLTAVACFFSGDAESSCP